MDILTKNNLDKQNFSLFIRDLSQTLNSNLKHIIEDTINEKKVINKNHKKPKKQVKKKADIIIEQQTAKRLKEQIDNDLKKIDLLKENIDLDNPFKYFSMIKTKAGNEKFKYILFVNYWNHKEKNKYMKYIITLYFNLKDTDNKDYKEFIDKVGIKLEKYEYKLYMMKEIGNLLPPLNFWDTVEKKLDEWQKAVIKYVKKNESVLVRAPTSAGKTWIAMSAGIMHKKIIYVCPAKPVAYQVGSHFILMGYKVHYLVDDLCYNSINKETNIYVGTPKVIEDNLHKIGNNFDYAVFDEIHNVNKSDDGDIYENLIKILKCNFLALSATIGNIDYLNEIFKKINPDKNIHYIEYNKRFINHQRYIYNEKLIKLHPLCSTEIEDLNEDFLKNSLSFTPNDCAVLWEWMEENIDEDLIDELSPDEYFKESRMLTLDDCSNYEKMLKNFIINNKENIDIEDLLNYFKKDLTSNSENIVEFLRNCKESDMLPMIIFNNEENICKKIFYEIYENLHNSEIDHYPFHYSIMDKKHELYEKYLEEREIFKSKIKISKTCTDARNEITEKMENYDKRELEKYKNAMNEFYEWCINTIENDRVNNEYCTSYNYVDVPGKDKKLKKLRLKNIQKELKNFNENPDFYRIDRFQKHEDFCFTMKEPMSGDTIKSIRREIMKTLKIEIAYDHPIFQMLKRGIGLYIESMPDEYKWILQKLMSKREIGVIISDKTLCLGIDLPIRSSVLMQHKDSNVKFTNEDYLQMAGRAGRRGMDDRGNVIFYGDIDYLSLMKGILPELRGSDKIISGNYRILDKISKIDSNVVFNNFINPKRKTIHDTIIKLNDNEKLLWYLRNYDSYRFVKDIKNLERKMFELSNDFDKEIYLINTVCILIDIESIENIIKIYKSNRIEDKICTDIYKIKELYEIIINIYNNLNKDIYLLTRKFLRKVYEKMSMIIIKTNGF